MKKSNILKLVVSLAIPVALGSIAGISTSAGTSGWLDSLNSPTFRPPNWLFGPVWTALYLLMGFSLFLIWEKEASKQRNTAITVFFIQLMLNFLWSFHFLSVSPNWYRADRNNPSMDWNCHNDYFILQN